MGKKVLLLVCTGYRVERTWRQFQQKVKSQKDLRNTPIIKHSQQIGMWESCLIHLICCSHGLNDLAILSRVKIEPRPNNAVYGIQVVVFLSS